MPGMLNIIMYDFLCNSAISSAASSVMACACLVVVYQYLKRNCTCLRKADIRKIPGVGM